MLHNSFFTIILFGLFISSTTARRRRQCRNSSLAIENIRIKFYQKHSTKILADGNITRYLTVNWTLEGADTSKMDGYLIRMREATASIRSSMAPLQDLEASLTKLWIRTNNLTECSDRTETTSLNGSEVDCWCNASSCVFLDGLNCLPATALLHSRLGGHYAIPHTRTGITYETKYQTQYTLDIYPYYRQFKTSAPNRLTIEKAWSCAEDVSVISNISVAEADLKCCEKGFPAFSALYAKTSKLMIDIRNATLNISISWIPPAMKGYLGSEIRAHPNVRLEKPNDPQYTAVESEGSYNENITCQTHNRTETATIYNLQPNMFYTVNIYTWHSSVRCQQGCTKTIEINTDLCVLASLKCSNHASCKYDIATFKGHCECDPGYTGNGISTSYNNGTGCEAITSAPTSTPMHEETTIQYVEPTTSHAVANLHNIFLIIFSSSFVFLQISVIAIVYP